MTYTKSLTVAETAKELRKALKAEFPGVKFSVRSDSYAGGASIRVRWTDGPREQLVKRVCARFEGASFDGMIDLKSYHTTVVANPDGSVEEIHYGADFIFADRDVSPERDALIRELYEHCIGRPYDPSDSERLPDSYRVSDPRVDWDEVLRGVRGIWSSSLYGAIERVV